MQTAKQIKQVIHQSRRGLKELDVILEKFNQKGLIDLDERTFLKYIELLKTEDHDLLNLLMDKQNKNKLIQKIIQTK